MTTERIDIVVSDGGTTRTVQKDLQSLGTEALGASSSVRALKNSFEDYALRVGVAAGVGAQKFAELVKGISAAQSWTVRLNAAGAEINRSFNTSSATASVNTLTKATEKATAATKALNGASGGGGGRGGGIGGGGAGPKGPGPNLPGLQMTQQELNKIGATAHTAGRSVDFLNTLLYTLGIGTAIEETIKWSDAWTSVQNRLTVVTKDAGNLAAVNEVVFASAQKTRTAYVDMATLFQQLTTQSERYGLSQQRVASLAETIRMAANMSATSPAAANASVAQLEKALAGSKIQARQLNSLLSNTPMLAKAIADGMGTTSSQLRVLNQEKKLHGSDLVRGLENSKDSVAQDFLKTTPTIVQGAVVLNNAMIELVGKFNEATGFGKGFAGIILLMARNADVLATALVTVGVALLTVAGPIALKAILGLWSTLLANPIGLIIAGVVGLAAAFIFMGDRVKTSADGVVTLKDDFLAALSFIKQGAMAVWDWFVKNFFTPTATQQKLDENKAMWSRFWTSVGDFAKGYVNFVIGAWRAIYDTAVTIFQNLPGVIVDFWTSAINMVLELNQKMINAIIDGINLVPGFFGVKLLDHVTIEPLVNKFKGTLSAVGGSLGAQYGRDFGTDYAGAAIKAVGGAASRIGAAFQDRARQIHNSRGQKGVLGTESGVPEPEITTPVNSKAQTRIDLMLKEYHKLTDQIHEALNPDIDYTNSTAYKAVDALNESLISHKNKDGSHWKALTNDERSFFLDLALQEERETQVKAVMNAELKRSIEPQRQYNMEIEATTKLMAEGKITSDAAERSMRAYNVQFLAANNFTASSGLKLGKATAQQDALDGNGKRTSDAYTSAWKGANDGMLQFIAQETALKQLLADDPIHSGQYKMQIDKLGFAYVKLKLDLDQGNFADTLKAGLGDLVQGFQGILPGLGAAWGQFFTTFTDGFANSIGRAIVYSENLGSAIMNVARGALSALISALVKMGIQWVIMHVLGTTLGTTAAAASILQGTTVAAAWAPAAAMVSLATFGANAAPAALAGVTTTALFASLAAVGGAGGMADGGPVFGPGGPREDKVPRWLSAGEYVVNADATRRNRSLLDSINYGGFAPGKMANGGYVATASPSLSSAGANSSAPPQGGGVTLNVHVDARGSELGVEQKVRQVLQEEGPKIVDAARQKSAEDMRSVLTRNRMAGNAR
jgi:tape measure domain-containing protein